MKSSLTVRKFLLLSGLLISLTSASFAQKAESSIVVEAHSGKVLSELNATARRPVASLTKIATACVVIDWAEITKANLNTLAVVPNDALQVGGANPMGLRPGDQISLRNALYSSLLGSDNVAALTLSTYIGAAINMKRGRSGNAGKTFVTEMNQLMKSLGARSTKFTNPHGLDNSGSRGYSTAEDMARLSIYAMRKPALAFYVKQKSRSVSFTSAGQKRTFQVKNTNLLLGQLGVVGLKTGTTPLAGQCLVTCAERKPIVQKLANNRTSLTPRRLIVVTLGSLDRFGRSRQLMQTGWSSYDTWIKANGQPVPGIPTKVLQVTNPR